MRHPSEGTLRRLLDEPAGVPDADRTHAAGCPTCLGDLSAMRADAATVDAALGAAVAVDIDAGWRRLSAARAAGGPDPTTEPAETRRWRAAVSRPVVAVVGALALVTGAGAAAAADWLPIFRTEQVAPITLTRADLVALPDLSAYGEFEVTDEPRLREVPDRAAAKEATGLTAPRIRDLPRGVAGDPTFRIGDRMSAAFTFSAEKTARTAEAAGESLPAPPPGLDGSRFRLVAGPGVATVWSSRQGFPALIAARASAPEAFSSGVPFAQARDYLLALPGLPEDLAAQLRGISGDSSTLPLPVPTEELTSAQVEVDGAPATVLTARDGTLAGVVWVRDGVVTAVAGSLSRAEVLTVARELR